MNERIKKLRKTLRFTQQEFAERLGLKQNTIAVYESGRAAPGESTVRNMCTTFGVSENWLRTGEGEMFGSAVIKNDGLTHEASVFVEKLAGLPAADQAAIMNFLKDVVNNF